ncbi:MAG: GTP 3',8-cyclase MoaA, partial [Chloroflexi bacterium]
EEISAVVQIAAELGINKVRLTGGEPLIRAELPELIRMLSEVKGIDDISLTTNGTLLKKYAMELKQAGLKRVNISLDTFKSDRFRYITRCGELKDALDGIDAAMNADLHPVKINMVVMRGINDDEVLDFARMTCKQGWHVRFIERMPFTEMAEVVSSDELRQRIMAIGSLLKAESYQLSAISGNGPARYYRLPGASGTIGFISPITEPFCSDCNRLRLTSNGRLCPCLLSDEGVDLKQPLRSEVSSEEIKRLISKTVALKSERHHLCEDVPISIKRRMSQAGG